MTWAPGEVLTAANLNLYLPQAQTTWSSPIAGGITVGSGTTVATYSINASKKVEAGFKFTFGAGSAVTGNVTLTLPAATANTRMAASMNGYYDDATGSVYPVFSYLTTGSTVITLTVVNTAGTYPTAVALSSTVPFTWASGDAIFVQFDYFTS